ncbi:MAG: PEGA domain-containing protein [Kiritimatiellia bacterium]|jgi:alpha-tubulin suppressor-like RCC1 family protein
MKMRLLITGAPCKNPCPRTWRGHPARVSWASRPCREGLFRSLFAALVLGSIASVSAAGGFRGFRFTQHPQSQIADENGQATLSVAVEGTGPFSYQWYKDAQPVVGATGQTMAISNIGCGGDALYHCVVTSPGRTATTHIANVSSALCAVAAWGENVYGQCDVPAGLADVVAVEGGAYHSLALKADGTVITWGANWYGQCDVPAGLADVVAVEGGAYHSLALKADGTVAAWGWNNYGQRDVPAGLADVVAVEAGNFHSLALKADGTVLAWGWNVGGQCDVPAGLADVVAVEAGIYHNLALRAEGTVAAWGANWDGQCDVPAGLADVVAVSAGANHSLALKADGTVVAWGWNVGGQCDIPAGLADVVAVAAGEYHSLALKADGTVVAWGANWDGQCDVPPGLADVVAVSAGADHSLALAEPKPPRIILQPTSVAVHSGQRVDLMSDVFSLLPCTTTWFKQGVADAVGTGTTWIKADVQVADAGNYYLVASNALGVVTSEVVSVVVDPTPFVAILPCRYSDIPLAGESLTLTANAWGERPMTYTWVLNGQTVLTSTTPEWTLPVLTEALTGICQLIVSNSHGTAASRLFNLVPIQPGLVAAWGSSDSKSAVPAGLKGVVAVAVGGGHSLALKADGTVVAWGWNVYGQCDVPAGLADVVAVEGGTYHSLALKADGTVIAWGANWDGQCDVPAGLEDVGAVAAGEYHSLALKADGTVIAWGWNNYGQCDVPAGLADVVAVEAGNFHNLALKADGIVIAWGANWDGQCDVPAGLTDVVAVEAGNFHNLALKADGTVIAWGANWDGQCDIPAGLADVVAVAAGEYHSLALKADGTVIAWGANWYGQCDVPPFCSPSLDIAAGWFQSLSIIPDSDGDGVADAVELDLGRDPNDPSDGDVAVSAAGRVSSPSGAIDGAVVTLRGASGWIYCRTTTDANGSYAIGEVIPGHYRIKVEASGFADQWYAGAEHAGGALDCAIMGTSPVAMPDFLLVPGQSPALVEVTSDPPGAAIYLDFHPTGEVTPAVIDVGEIGTFDSAGTLLASHVITLKRHGAPQPVPRTIAPVEAETIVEHFDLTDETSGAVLVETTPAGAEVFVDYADAPVGVTPVLVENLAPGFHTVLLRKEGYLRPRPVTARVLPHTGLAERSQANSFAAIGAAQGWQADDDCWGVVLPSRSRSMVSIEPTSLSTATGR